MLSVSYLYSKIYQLSTICLQSNANFLNAVFIFKYTNILMFYISVGNFYMHDNLEASGF